MLRVDLKYFEQINGQTHAFKTKKKKHWIHGMHVVNNVYHKLK